MSRKPADESAPPSSTRIGRAASEPSIASSQRPTPPIAYDQTMTPNTVGSDAADLPTLPPISPELYTVGFEIARGGMGRILAARDRKLRRDIVIKTLTPGGHAPRFEREALITARLQHPSIVRVYDAGQLAGEPFYAMEYVRGKSLDKVVATADSDEARLALLPHVIAIADALAYAHSEGIIHRDLKPANILVGSFGETIVIDWGLAKDMRSGEADSLDPERREPSMAPEHQPVGALGSADLTVAGAVMGTPSYMPPEQARGEPADERSDVYAIGAILYTVLAGTPPITGLRALDDARAGGVTPLRDRAPETPDELVTIVEHAMAFEPRERYSSARELAEDLRRFAAGKLVARHAYSTGALARRWLRRNRAPVAIAALAILALVVLSSVWVRGIAAERDDAREALEKTRTTLDETTASGDDLALQQAERTLAADPSAAIAWLTRLSDAGLERPRAKELAELAAARGVAFEFPASATLSRLVVAQPVGTVYTGGVDGQLVRWHLGTFKGVALGDHAAPISALATSPDGFWLATGSTDGAVKIWDLENVQGTPGPVHARTVRALAFSPDGNTVASVGEDGVLHTWTVLKHEARVLYKDGAGLASVAFSADGRLHVGTVDGRVLELDAGGKLVSTLRPHAAEVHLLAVSPDGKRLASGGLDGRVFVWAPGTRSPRPLAAHADRVRDLVWSPSGQLITAGGDPAIHVHDITSAETFDLAGNPAAVLDLAVSAGSIAAAGADGKLRVWPRTGGNPTSTLVGHRVPITGVAFTNDGGKVLSIAEDRMRMWPLAAVPPAPSGKPLATWLASRTNLTVAR